MLHAIVRVDASTCERAFFLISALTASKSLMLFRLLPAVLAVAVVEMLCLVATLSCETDIKSMLLFPPTLLPLLLPTTLLKLPEEVNGTGGMEAATDCPSLSEAEKFHPNKNRE